MRKITGLLIFGTGFLSGSISAYIALKEAFRKHAEEEIQSVKDSYRKAVKAASEVEKTLAEMDAYGLKMVDSTKEADKGLEGKAKLVNADTSSEEKDFSDEKPYIISPIEFGEVFGYETNTCTLYADGVVADEDMNIITDVDNLLGNENLKELENSEDDCIFIRNDSEYCDYEVLKDYDCFDQNGHYPE